MAISPSFWARDPLALAILKGGLAIQRCCHFEAHPRFVASHATQKTRILLFSQMRTIADFYHNARSFQAIKALARYQGVGVRQGCHHFANFGLDQGVATGACSAMVCAGFQRDVGSSAFNAVALVGSIL
jgi:hypothetical protein